MKNITLQDVDYLRPHDKDAISKYLISEVEKMIEEANEETKLRLGNTFDQEEEEEEEEDLLSTLPLPLIRLRVNYSASGKKGASTLDYQVENPRRFSNRFVGRVANTNNVVQFYKKKNTISTIEKKSSNDISFNESDVQRVLNANGGELHVDTLISELLGKMQLSLLPEVGMNEAVKKFVDKDEKAALKEFINNEIKNEVQILSSNKDFLENENIDDFKSLVKEVKKANIVNNSSSLNLKTGEHELSTTERSTEQNIKNLDNIMDDTNDDFKHSFDARLKTSTTEIIATPKRNTKAKKSPISDSIVISEEEDSDEDAIIIDADSSEDNDEDSEFSPRDLSKKGRSEPNEQNHKRTVSQTKAKPKSKTSSKTPKTDVLAQLLARKKR